MPAALLHRAVQRPGSLGAGDVAVLQRAIGNRAVGQLLAADARNRGAMRSATGAQRADAARSTRRVGTGRRVAQRAAGRRGRPADRISTSAETLVQRAVGFEFETPWSIEHAPWTRQTGSNLIKGIGALGGGVAGYMTGGLLGAATFGAGAWLGSKAARAYEDMVGLNYSPMTKYQEAYRGDGWKLTADYGGTGTVMEFVVDPVEETNDAAGATRLQTVMTDLLNYTTPLSARNAEERFTLDTVTHRDSDRRYRIVLGEHDLNMPLRANPQTTAGVRLDRIGHLTAEVAPPGAARTQLMGMDDFNWGPGVRRYYQFANAEVNASLPPNLQTPQLKGLVSLIVSYLSEGAPGAGGTSDQYSVEYAKHIAILMPRTDFAALYNARGLEGARAHFATNAGSWVALVMGAAMRDTDRNWDVNDRAGADGLLLERSVNNNNGLFQPDQFATNPTRRAWLEGMQAGADLSTRLDPSSMGKLGNRMDRVGPDQGEQGAILEFRKMQGRIPHTQWGTLALRIFNYVSALNGFDPTTDATPHY